jgi:hypothetical protein
MDRDLPLEKTIRMNGFVRDQNVISGETYV